MNKKTTTQQEKKSVQNPNLNQKQTTQEKKTYRSLIIYFKDVYSIFHNERNAHFNEKLFFIFQWMKFRNLIRQQ